MKYKIFDFHTHPFLTFEQSICVYKNYVDMTPQFTVDHLKSLGIYKMAGCVLNRNDLKIPPEDKDAIWRSVKHLNDTALELKKLYGDFYEPGFNILPSHVKESCDEIDRMEKNGVKLIGELLPYWYRYSFGSDGMDEILDYATKKGMIISLHTCDDEALDAMIKKHPDTVIVGAHPGERPQAENHMRRMEMSENYYMDISGTGLFRLGILREFIAKYGVERILFGSDYPTCAPSNFVGGVILEPLFSEEEKEMILYKNAERLFARK